MKYQANASRQIFARQIIQIKVTGVFAAAKVVL